METQIKKIKLVETFDGTPSISLVEDKINETTTNSRVDGKYIIGMIEGQFFKPDGMSRNGRWYPRTLWEKALNSADVKNRFNTSTMFGEIGHSDGPVEDLKLRTGCDSHFIDKMWITEDGKGMGRAYILNTPTGQLLKTYLGAGCKLKVSTRGEGIYKEGCTHDGCPIVDDNTYELQTADFVLNPGFLETSAVLKEEYTKLQNGYSNKDKEQIKETIAHVKKEGEKRMTLDIDAYVAELKAERDAFKAENKSLTETLQAKEKELLQKEFKESAEMKKINEAYAPFKKMGVSAKTLNETLKKAQENLKKEKSTNFKLVEEIESYKAKCGSIDEVDAAIKYSTKALKMIEEYQAIGTPEDLKAAKDALEKAMPKLKEHEAYKALGSVDDLKRTASLVEKVLPQLRSQKRLIKEVKEAEESVKKAMRVIKGLHEIALKTEKLLPQLKEAKKLKANSKKLISNLKEAKTLRKNAEKALTMLEAYKEAYGPIKVKTNVKNEALELSKKYGCTVESAAKLVKKHGLTEAVKMVESALSKKKEEAKNLTDGKKLVEDLTKLDEVKDIPAEKTAKDFLKDGMLTNYFNHEALGKEVTYPDINTIDGTKPQKHNAAKELLKKYKDNFEVAEGPKGLKGEVAPAEAESEVKKLLGK